MNLTTMSSENKTTINHKTDVLIDRAVLNELLDRVNYLQKERNRLHGLYWKHVCHVEDCANRVTMAKIGQYRAK